MARARQTARSSTRPSARRKAPPQRPVKKKTSRASGARSPAALPVEVDPESVESTLARVRNELTHWVNQGRYTRVRFKLRGKPILPDIPVGAVVAAEAMTFWWAGLLRALMVTLGAQAVLDVEWVHDAEREVARGKEALLAGDLERAQGAFRKAIKMNRESASAHLSLGIVHKLQGEWDKARRCLEKAAQLGASGPVGDEARNLLHQLSKRS